MPHLKKGEDDPMWADDPTGEEDAEEGEPDFDGMIEGAQDARADYWMSRE